MSTSPMQLSRRQFIRLTAIAGLVAAGGAGWHATHTANHPERVQETRMLLGSIAHLTLISEDAPLARAAIGAALDQMVALESVLSRFQTASPLSQLNANGSVSGVHPALHTVISKALDYGDLTQGAFDITIEPVLRLYREASKHGALPDELALQTTQALVDYRQISLTQDTITLNKTGMALTLDGIAKGYIIDAGTAVLREYGFEHIMVELGGDLQTSGNAVTRPWQISIQQPSAGQSDALIAQISGSAMATSGDYQYTFTADRRLHHIIDPDSGISPLELASASVIAPTVCDADALSTALMVMGAENGLALIERLPDTAALVINKQGRIQHTANFPLV